MYPPFAPLPKEPALRLIGPPSTDPRRPVVPRMAAASLIFFHGFL